MLEEQGILHFGDEASLVIVSVVGVTAHEIKQFGP